MEGFLKESLNESVKDCMRKSIERFSKESLAKFLEKLLNKKIFLRKIFEKIRRIPDATYGRFSNRIS